MLAAAGLALLVQIGSRRRWHFLALVVMLAPCIAIAGIAAAWNGRGPSLGAVAYVMCAAVFVMAGAGGVPVRLIGGLGIATSVTSLVLGALGGGALMPPSANDANKSFLFERLLAGPYGHSNTLAIVVALTFPFVWRSFPSSRFLRSASALLMLVTLLWCGSRTVLGALAVGLVIWMVARMVRHTPTLQRAIGLVMAVLSIAVMLAVPMVTGDAGAFTSRGRIWQAAIEYGRSAGFFGLGPWAFSERGVLTSSLGFTPEHGHNVAVSAFAMGGLVGLVAVMVLLAGAWRGALRGLPGTSAPLLFVATLTCAGALETVIDVRGIGAASFVALPMLAQLLATQRPDPASWDVRVTGAPTVQGVSSGGGDAGAVVDRAAGMAETRAPSIGGPAIVIPRPRDHR
ncbi:O-antigen ligase [Actinotalea sp. JY-7876]|uniref:O-antigen ligase family protein n=1 Tax=Actinotalea sp. JY-7876 TaxID=2758442 RepID=UPI0015F76E2F|nr:O-antigen ligase family protein [Actinotalea sp. JY-7876]